MGGERRGSEQLKLT
uniref:Uncharacterized protein n=1 Tax=Rhizophora mucronata TaxID=61149 RepID=A0A2P2R171_RHIMU